MKTLPLAIVAVVQLISYFGNAQSVATTDANRKTGIALRTQDAPKVDGLLDDVCWIEATPMTDFVTFSPDFGRSASEKTEVRVVYTDEAVYIGAYLYQKSGTIRTDLSTRDGESTADAFHIGLDTYRDRLNAFRFQITAGGVQSDIRMSPDAFDQGWDAVWDAEVKLHLDGWSVELRIPFSAIRFPKQEDQHWGIQFARQIQYVNEFNTWSPVDPNGGGTLPQWGNLEGLNRINPPLRLAFSPYIAGSVQRSPVSEDPVAYAGTRTLSGGMDVKWGLSESFTVDATLIPNFGEAQSDNLVRNLTPFEVQYEERRQFFTEGTELFSKGNIFYSRRIGGLPKGFYEVEVGDHETITQNPSQTQLYNATKLSGRTRSKLGIGVLNAVSAPAFAEIRNDSTGTSRKFQTSPLSNFNVLVLDQALPYNSAISFANTNVVRAGAARDANVSALSFNLRDAGNQYELYGSGQFSAVFNPENNPSEEQKTGYGYSLGLRKVSGSWTGGLDHQATSNGYDPSDLGFFRRVNFTRMKGYVSYGDFKQKGNVASRFVNLTITNTWLKSPFLWESLELESFSSITWANNFNASLLFFSRPFWFYDYFEPRTAGAKYYHAPYVFFGPGIETNSSKRLFASFRFLFGESPIPNDPYIGINFSPTWVMNDHLRLSSDMSVSKDHSNFGYVSKRSDNDIIFGRRDITTFDNSLTAQVLFGPRMNLSVRARHYWLQLYYHGYLHLNQDGTFSPTDWNGTADENFNQFNIDLVYTWQFAPGSFLNLIWKDAIFSGDAKRGDNYFRNWNKTFQAPQNNSLTLKLIYWLDAGNWFNRN
ncbi:MAG: carbohydrate binding family 9 domain-containing protein [Saprospiraceae bacterium]|nr:carbohydrate binding family 9 domain-containing protein [Saprospiraceae bacterium]